MVGAKQFAMMRETRKSGNPLNRNYRTMPVKAMSGSFLDRLDDDDELPISKPVINRSSKMKMPDLLSNFFAIAMPVMKHELQEHVMEEETEKNLPEIDERTINMISNRIFKNLKNYLENSNNNQKRNVEISIKL